MIPIDFTPILSFLFKHIFQLLFQWLPTIGCPVTIFHAEDDHVCPITVAEHLVADATALGKTNIKLVRFKEAGMGHVGIAHHKDFPKVMHDAVVEAHKNYESKEVI